MDRTSFKPIRNSIYFFFLISLGFLAFLFDNDKIKMIFPIDLKLKLDYSKCFFAISVILALLSLIASSITVLSRLHDLRLTRHTIWTKKRYYDKNDKVLNDQYIDLKLYGFRKRLENFISTLKNDNYFITDTDIINSKIIDKKFQKLRLRNLLLAKFSWWSINFQIFSLLFSLFIYAISLLV